MADFGIYPATVLQDAEQLREAVESAVRHPLTQEVIIDEVDEILASVDAARQDQGDRYYAVSLTSGNKALGIMGLQPPDKSMVQYTDSDNPVELINACVLKTVRGAGVGRALVRHLESEAIERGHTEIILNSGPRYMRSGWPFWRRMYGEPVAVAKDYYGPRFDAMVWRKSLSEQK